MIALEVKNLTVRLVNNPIIQNLNFKIKEGSITVIIGPNGAGKTTLLKTIIGLLPYQGEIKILDGEHKSMLSSIGYVPQVYTVDNFLPITVKEFLYLSIIDDKNFNDKIDDVNKYVSIAHLYDKKLNQLSGGQLERVLFARSLLNNPKILILDEPISETDISGQEEFYVVLKKLNQEKNITILIVTHELSLIDNFASHVLCLNHRMICDLPAKELKGDVLKKLYNKDLFVYPFNNKK
ncbi:MAG: putative metal transport system ATP-binding protein [Candidatus Parcubacteria bacterium]|nr:MAG: putative metal transport system ATP-binding protein [Candidatus Parcubacteria bacterium]